MVTRALLNAILNDYRLPIDGLHGIGHWARVLENGRRLCQQTGAKLAVVELFAVFHDARRRNEGTDPFHGQRGAEYAASLRGTLVQLDPVEFDQLYYACAYHTKGLTEANETVQACWDSDRLDLARAGIYPNDRGLCTAAARKPEMIDWANGRSTGWVRPALLQQEWGIPHSNGE